MASEVVSEYHRLPPNRERSCHIILSSLGIGGLLLACPRDAEDNHIAIFVFVIVVFAVVFIIVVLSLSFAEVKCGFRGGARWT